MSKLERIEDPWGDVWCHADDVDKLEAQNAELLQFVQDFLEAREKGREDEQWLADAAWELIEKFDITESKGEEQ